MKPSLTAIPSDNRTAFIHLRGQLIRLHNASVYLPGVEVEPDWYAIRGRNYVYFHLDADDNTVYIGISTSGLLGRLQQHAKSSPWFAGVHAVEVDEWPTPEDARYVEIRLIRRYRPLFNRDRCDGTYQPLNEFRQHLSDFYSGTNPRPLKLVKCHHA